MTTTFRRALVAPLLLAALGGLLLTARPAAAHPLDVYLQSSYLTIAATSVELELDLSPGVLVAPAVLTAIDTDGDHDVTDAEAKAYAATVLANVTVAVDGTPWQLELTSVDTPSYLVLQAGYGTVRVHATATGGTDRLDSTDAAHELTYRNGFTGPNVSYQVNAYLDNAVTIDRQDRSDTQQQSTVTYTVGAGTSAAGTATAAGAADTSASPTTVAASTSRLAGYLEGPSMSLWFVLVALGAAVLLGALHALTPGHAKTLMAAYLVGNNGTSRNAATLGAVVTFTHTASVIVIGLIALLASRFLVPGVLVPGLEVVSGLIVIVLGARLLWRRWRDRRPPADPDHVLNHVHEQASALVGSGAHEHSHGHPHERDHPHGYENPHEHPAHVHSHGGRAHTHELPAGDITVRSLVAMGVSGGLVPCPEALGVMVVAVGVGRTVLGLGLIVAFSVGLAAVLIGFGVLLVRSHGLVTRLSRRDHRWVTTTLPVVSAGVVTLLGVGLVVKALTSVSLPFG